MPAGYEALAAPLARWRKNAPAAAAIETEHPTTGRGGDGGPTRRGLRALQARLRAIDPTSWPVEQQVDYALVRAEMNGLDFDLRVLQPVGARSGLLSLRCGPSRVTRRHTKGTTHDRLIELWTYIFPLSGGRRGKKLASELRIIPPLLRQAGSQSHRQRARPVGHGHRDDAAGRPADLRGPEAAKPAPMKSDRDLDRTRPCARRHMEFVAWLEQQAPSKTGPSGDRQGQLHLEPAARAPRAP